MSLALARKYRPATFSDLIGQEAVSQTLSLALESNRLSHAYLFSGLRGSGKTSTARIFAKALLCEQGTTANPCGTCMHCTMAIENRHMDIVEMDAASNRGIDDIKDLIEHTKYKPSSARYKIFIIDEVHMLTPPAFNALLKTLEEPPDFVKFILATTDPLKLPATILSRTQHFRFKKISQNLVVKHLEHILNLENIGFESEAVEIIARSGAGSLRDSLTLLDQAIVYSKNYVDINTVTGMLGIIEPTLLRDLLQNILSKDHGKILEFIRMASDYEAEMILDELTLYLKELLLSQDTTLSPMIIERFFRIIAESKGLLSLGGDNEFVLSLTFFKMVEALQIKDIDAMIQGLERELKGIEINEIIVTKPEENLPREVITITQEEIAPYSYNKSEISEPVTEKAVEEESKATNQPSEETQYEDSQKSTSHQKVFDNLVQKIFDRNYELGMCFETNITFQSFADGKLTWESTAQGEEKKMLITHWGIIHMFVKELFGMETKIINVTKEQNEVKKKLDEPALNPLSPRKELTQEEMECNASASMLENVEMKSSCIAPEAGDTEAAKEKDPSTLLEEPMIKTAIELFNPKKVRIKRKS